MMICREEQVRNEVVVWVAKLMMAAARTAPKGRGTDTLEIVTIGGGALHELGTRMRGIGERTGQEFFIRDAGNVEQSEAVVLIGSALKPLGLNCGYCGFATCADKGKYLAIPCAFNTCDLGIALGSAVSVAAQHRVDSRIMYSAGRAALELGMLAHCSVACAIPLSCTGKSPFFDRNHPPKSQG